MWDDTPASMAAARKATYKKFSSNYLMRAQENACFVVLTDQVGRAGYVDTYPKDSELQPHHAGSAMVLAPCGKLLKAAQHEEIREEMIVCDLEAERLHQQRSLANYTLKTRRPEIYGELVRDQISC